MKISINQKEFYEALQTVANVVSQKQTLPILSNILLEARKDRLQLIGTDLEIGISTWARSETHEEGGITLPAKKLVEVIKELPNKEVLITARKNNSVSIECQRSFFRLMGLPREDFPKLPKFNTQDSFSIEQPILKKMLRLTGFAISLDETRYVLNGIYLVTQGGMLRMVATDGRRLAMIQKKGVVLEGFEKEVIVPTKTVHELNRLLKEEGDVQVVFGDNQLLFDLGKTQIVSRLVEGKFPNYQQAIPTQSGQQLQLDREQFLLATRRASLLTSGLSQAVKVELLKGKMVITGESPELGEAREEIEIAHQDGQMTVGFNPGYLLDALKSLDENQIMFEMIDAETAGVIRAGEDYLYVVMPMQLAGNA